MNDGWFDDDGGAEYGAKTPEREELLEEFEKMLKGEDSEYLAKKKEDSCMHFWVKSGNSPITNEQWWNCKHCDLAKEKHDKARQPT